MFNDDNGVPITEGKIARATRIKKCRKEKGLTQAQLGDLLGLSTTAIMRYEKAQREPKIDILSSMAKIFGVPLTYLMGYNEDLSSPFDGGHIIDDILALEISGKSDEASKLKNHYQIRDYPTVIDDRTGQAIPEDELKRRDEIIEDLIDLVETDYNGFHIMDSFNKLNSLGRKIAADRVEELTEIKKYQKK